MTEIRACYYKSRNRPPVLDLHYVALPECRPFKVETLTVADKRDARRVAAERGAIAWNF